ncbi:hypothetical protein T492DRAFT_153883 [Pavlovales sp. CCMP2436]|nr:hypothetical protein T492DRAFT_153883 [Pavlovales sp. CCMP2436]
MAGLRAILAGLAGEALPISCPIDGTPAVVLGTGGYDIAPLLAPRASGRRLRFLAFLLTSALSPMRHWLRRNLLNRNRFHVVRELAAQVGTSAGAVYIPNRALSAHEVCKYLEIRPSPDRSPPDPSVEKHSEQGTFAEHTDTEHSEHAHLAAGEDGIVALREGWPALQRNPMATAYWSVEDYHLAYRTGRASPSQVAVAVLAGIQKLSHLGAFEPIDPAPILKAAAESDMRWLAGFFFFFFFF